MDEAVAKASAAADAAAAAGNLPEAHRLLGEAAERAGSDPGLWLKYAAISRALRRPHVALAAVNRALEASPLDFTALLLKASIITTVDEAGAGEAWAAAFAQQPEGPVAPAIEGVLAQGRAVHDAWLTRREQALEAAMASAERAASEEEKSRIARFRSNALRKTRAYHSNPTHFEFPGLVEHEFHPRSAFPWLASLEAATETISVELQEVLAAERTELVPYIQYAAHEPLDQWRPLNHNKDWTAIHLVRNGERVEANARHCPQTLALLEQLPQPQIPGAGPNAMFSLLAPGTHIPPHVGYNNARLVCHLPLIVPEGCWFRVGAETRHWQRGEAFVFDDTIEHEAMNPTDQLRIVFIVDVWHPSLGAAERDAVAALISCEGGAGSGL
jgi:aspartyl/asparaginyl beta-hydroxylase (cupin superfamily)